MDPTQLLTASLTPDLVNELLFDVIDPELGVNIVDLGLVYDVKIHGGDVEVVMTLTTQGCPLGGFIEDEILDYLAQAPQIGLVKVTLVWEPPWDPEFMTDTAREQLGWAS
jgi:metal-sulfur cluster biosynthetic enzyme